MADVEYKLNGPDGPARGSARTVSLSSYLVIVESEKSFVKGQQIDLWMEWPVDLNEQVGLRLFIRGFIAEIRARYAAVQVQRYEFRTRPRHKAREGEVKIIREPASELRAAASSGSGGDAAPYAQRPLKRTE